MKPFKYVLVALLLAGITNAGFGWGNATHMYFAKRLGSKLGKMNLNEMYGAVLPDLFNLDMTPAGQLLASSMHEAPLTVAGNAGSCELKAIVFGFASHNNAWGADHIAHMERLPGLKEPGWVIVKGMALVPGIAGVLKADVIKGVVLPDDAYDYIALQLGHDLTETAVDLMVKRHEDRLIGLEMMIAAKQRPSSTGTMLAAAYAKTPGLGVSETDAEQLIIGAEHAYQEGIIQYGQAFTLPEQMTIELLAESTVPVATGYISALVEYFLGGQLPGDVSITVTKDHVKTFLRSALQNVRADYADELSRTLRYVSAQLDGHSVATCQSFFAMHSEAELQGQEAVSAPAAVAPTEYSLAGNYPNPFNPSTVIRFALPAASHVRLAVYNAIGEEVATLADGQMSDGWHEIAWNAAGLPSGVYFCRLQARSVRDAESVSRSLREAEGAPGNFIQTKRMMLIK